MHPCWLLGSTSVTTNGHGSQSLSRFESTEFMLVDTCNCSTVGLKFYIKACYKLYTGVEPILSIFAQKDIGCAISSVDKKHICMFLVVMATSVVKLVTCMHGSFQTVLSHLYIVLISLCLSCHGFLINQLMCSVY